jgi:diguanylate cyclase (GGDEF)-like protein
MQLLRWRIATHLPTIYGGLKESSPYESLVALLRELGVRVIEEGDASCIEGFPISLPLKDGSSLTLDLPEPAMLGTMDPETVGVATLDSSGYVTRNWGLARRSPFLQPAESCLLTQLGNLVTNAFDGTTGTLYIDGFRYYVAATKGEKEKQVIVLVTSASEERSIRKQASKSTRAAAALKRIGKALTMDQRMQQLGLAAVHEIASVAELAAVLLWIHDPEHNVLKLTASVGANRNGTALLSQIEAAGGSSCVAELVAAGRQPFVLSNVNDHMMTTELEAKFCYLQPGGLSVHPLVISDKLLGVLELVGREGDPHFDENQELFQTVAEHLALALNSAVLFESFEKMATHDALTGIANHRTMQEFLARRFAEAQRMGQELGLLMVDVDHFRSFNEEEGHDAGDEVLRLVAEALKAAVRPYDLAARYGGEEFTVVMPGSSMASSMAVAERIRKKVSQVAFTTGSGRGRHVTVSIGCACFPKNAKDAASLLKAADSALYQAKRNGRNKVVAYKGAFTAGAKQEEMDLTRCWEWVAEEDREAAETLVEQVKPHLVLLKECVALSASQHQILEGLVIVVTTYRRLKGEDPDEILKSLESFEEFRILQPSLDALEERFDGQGPQGMEGPRIPLLARALSVLLAVVEERGRPLLEDPARFDPEIVSVLSELDDAA